VAFDARADEVGGKEGGKLAAGSAVSDPNVKVMEWMI
jgi:hypothetical protein